MDERPAREHLDGFVERIRVASFEEPRALSHSEWAESIRDILRGLVHADAEGR
jgi:hypothetical protein